MRPLFLRTATLLGHLALVAAAFGSRPATAGEAPQRTLEFSWPAIDRAKSYELKFSPAGKNAGDLEPVVVTSLKNAWKGKLRAGTYQLRMRTIDLRGVPGPWGEPRPVTLPLPAVEPVSPAVNATVKSKETDKTTVGFSWKPLGDEVVYRVEVRNVKGKVVFGDDTEDAKIEAELPVSAAYSWSVTARGEDGTKGEAWEKARQFRVVGGRLAQPEITVPFEPETPLVKWSKPANAQTFAIKLTVLDEKTGKWKPLLDDKAYKRSDLKMAEGWPEGQYRLYVAAQGPLRDSSSSTVYDFETGVRAAVKGKIKSAHRFQGGYAFAPTLRTVSILASNSAVEFNTTTANSHIVAAGYRFVAFPHAFGLQLSTRLMRGRIFDDEQTQASLPDQEPIDLDSTDFRFLGSYEWVVWRLALGLDAGVERHDLHVLYPVGLTSFDVESVRLTDLLVGPSVELVLGPSSTLGGSLLVGRALADALAQGYSRSIVELRFARKLWDDRLAATLAALQDTVTFQFASPETAETYSTRWTNRQIAMGLAYVF